MKLKALTSIGIMLILCFFTSNLFAQITISNNLGIFPGPFPFTGTEKFTSIGESGGFVGPTDDGCDFYGFRAQTSLGNNVNMGIRIVDDGSPLTRTVRTPTILWGDNKRLEFLIKGTPNGQSGGANLTCGKRIAYLYDSPGNDFVLTLYGSGRALGGIWQASDRKLKQNIKEIPNALNLVRQLNGVSYDYLNDQFADLNLPKTQQYGFIAQDVERILPSAVRDAGTDEFQKTDFKLMQYTQLIPVLTEAIKEQQGIIEQQEERILEQEQSLEDLEVVNQEQADQITALNDRLAQIEAMLSGQSSEETPSISIEGVSLQQNRPNPFKGKTVINYEIPSDMNTAQLAVYDLSGKLLNNFDLAPGNGQVTINSSELSSGVYVYTIEHKGQTIARQRMIVK